ncbi:hypothetical protein HaLaN_16296, partial [Haematococcus lacustris]
MAPTAIGQHALHMPRANDPSACCPCWLFAENHSGLSHLTHAMLALGTPLALSSSPAADGPPHLTLCGQRGVAAPAGHPAPLSSALMLKQWPGRPTLPATSTGALGVPAGRSQGAEQPGPAGGVPVHGLHHGPKCTGPAKPPTLILLCSHALQPVGCVPKSVPGRLLATTPRTLKGCWQPFGSRMTMAMWGRTYDCQRGCSTRLH